MGAYGRGKEQARPAPAGEVSLLAPPHCSGTVWGRSWSAEARLLEATLLLTGFGGAAPLSRALSCPPLPTRPPFPFQLNRLWLRKALQTPGLPECGQQ